MHRIHIFIILLSIIAFQPAQAADTETPERYVKLRILPERNNITAGEEIWIGIEQSIHPHWHTYWQNPGDSGSAPRTEWSAPSGFEISDIHWPTPNKIPYPPLLNYGYEDHVILLHKLKAPETLPQGPIKLSVDVDILVCKEECIPEFETLELTLNDPTAESEDNTAYLNTAQSKLPIDIDWSVYFSERNDQFAIQINLPEDLSFNNIDLNTIQFFSKDWGVIDNTAPINTHLENNILTITQQRGDRPIDTLKNIGGVLSYQGPDAKPQAISFNATPKSSTTAGATTPGQSPSASGNKTTYFGAIMLAIFGGMVLNLMPCVFPVLSIKALSLVKIADEHPNLARMHGLYYTAGVISSFVAISALLIALQAGGKEIGWGFQLQNPVVVSALAYLLFIVGLNLSGLFEFSGRLTNIGGKLAQGEGLSSSFFTGILATIVATPCTAPFMGAAIGFALTQSAAISLSIFAALGFGLALPYLLLSFAPFLQHIMPKPGAWMTTFKEFLAFPMYASSAWLVWVMSHQTASASVLSILIGMIFIVFTIWLLKHQPKSGKARITVKILTLLAAIIAISLLPFGDTKSGSRATSHSPEFGETYSAKKLTELQGENDPIFVEMTADWCITCKVNHKIAINKTSTKKLFTEKKVHYLIGDWTNQDPEITKYLNSFGRNGVPIYIYYGSRNEKTGKRPEPIILPQVLTPAIVAKHIQ